MKNIEIVNKAVIGEHILDFDYVNGKGERGRRHVQAEEVQAGNLLIAFDLKKNGYRRFLLNNMENLDIVE